MKVFRRLFRIIKINFTLARYNIDEILLGKHRFYPLRFVIYFNPYYWTHRKKLSRGERIRRALEELGPIFVKAGQILSTRRDILPDDVATELSKLQDRVPPFSGKLAKKMIEDSLGASTEVFFSSIEVNALASASIAQVHAATLLSGEQVVIKVLRPHIRATIDRDIDLLQLFSTFLERYSKEARQLKARQIVDEIAQTLYDELDLLREGANASELRRHFLGSDLLYIPKIYWNLSRFNLLVMERIYGIPVHDIEQLKQKHVNLNQLAKRGIEIFFTQVFRDSFFHADLHPGNIFVNDTHPEKPSYITVDFGIVGSLNRHDQRYLAENMMAFFKRDYRRVAELHIACGWLPPDTRVDQFESAIRSVSEPIFEKPLGEISFGQLLLRLFQVARRFHINIQPQLILLQRALLTIEGLSRSLAPDLDLWSEATPHIEKWLKKQIGLRAFLIRIRENIPLWSEQFPELPSIVYEVFKEKKYEQERLKFSEKMLASEKNDKSLKIKFFLMGIVFSALFAFIVFYIL